MILFGDLVTQKGKVLEQEIIEGAKKIKKKKPILSNKCQHANVSSGH